MTKDGSVEFDARVKTGDLEKDLEKMEEVITDTAEKAEKQSDESSENIRSQVAKLAAEYKKAGMESSEAMKKAWAEIKGSTSSGADHVKQTVQRAFKDTKSIADSAFSEIAESAEDSLSDSGQIIDEFYDKVKSALTVAGITAGAAEIVKAGTDYDKAMQQVAASTGTAGNELENLQTIASNVYSNNFGENMEDAASGVTEIYKRTGLIDKELQKATESAFLLKYTFGYEVAESTQAASQLMKVFGITADEAYTLIAQGAQQGLDQNGDLLDTLNEYSVQFANLGYSADDMLNMLKNGVDKGTWSVDKLGDAVKEMNIRLNDGTADEALQALGLGFAESAANAKELEKAALNVSKAKVSLTQTQKEANKILAESGENSLEYRDALNDIAQVEIDLADAESAYNAAASATNYNLDGIKSKLAAGGETAKEAQQQILTALMSVEDEQERYVLGQNIMGTMWEDLGEDAVNALMNTQGEISRTKDTLEEMSEIKYDDLGSQFEALRRQAETEIIVPLAKKYMPKIKEAIGWVSENLDEIVSYGKPIATAMAAAFAVAKVVEFGNAASKTIKGVKTALTALNTSNPVGWILTAVGAVAGLNAKLKDMSEKRIAEMEKMREKARELTEEQIEQKEALEETAEAWDDVQKASRNSAKAADDEYKRIQELEDSLSSLVNADGTVKSGTKTKVEEILTEINELTGSCFELSGDLITQNGNVLGSYEAISQSIDNIIEKNRAMSYIDAYKDQYETAITSQKDNAAAVYDIKSDIKAEQGRREAAQREFSEKYKLYQSGYDAPDFWFDYWTERTKMENAIADSLEREKKLRESLTIAQTNQAEQNSMIDQYQTLLAMVESGNFEEANDIINKINNNFIDSAYASVEILKAQYETARQEYAEMKALAAEDSTAVTNEMLEDAKANLERAAAEYTLAGGNTGTEYIDALVASGMSEEEAFAELKKYIEEKLDNGESLNKIAADMGVNYSAGFEGGIRDGIPGVEEAVKALGAAAEATLRIKLDTHSPSKLTEKIGGYFDEGMELGVVKGIPGIEAVTAQMADAAVSSTLSIMNAQGADSVGAYSPVYKEVYNTSPVYNSQTVSTPSTSQPASAPSFSIYIGDEEIRQFVVDTITDENANSGGWSI